VCSACAPPPKKAKVHKAGKALAALGSVGAVASFLTPLGATLGVYAQAFSGATVESTVAAFALSCALRTAATKGLDLTPIPSSTAVLVVPVLASLYLVVSVLLGLSVRCSPAATLSCQGLVNAAGPIGRGGTTQGGRISDAQQLRYQ
jgi:hypothetical protein